MPMRNLAPAILLLISLTIAGCSDPKSAVLPQDIDQWVSTIRPLEKDLSDEDKRFLAGYVLRLQLRRMFGSAEIPKGFTVGDAIEHQRTFLKDKGLD